MTHAIRLVPALALAVAALSAASAARGEAADPSDALERGRQLLRAFEYDEAMSQLEAVAGDEAASASERAQALELMGALHMTLRRRDQARQVFERLLTMDPGHELTDPDIPPPVRQFYGEIQEGFEPSDTTQVEVTASDAVGAGGEVSVEATVSGETGGVDQALLFHRPSNGDSFQRIEMTRSTFGFSAEISVLEAGMGVDYYVEVRAPSGHVLARSGSEDAPLHVEAGGGVGEGDEGLGAGYEGDGAGPGTGTGSRWYTSWWFWTIVGVVVAGGTTTAIVLTLPSEEHQDGSLGSLQMP